MTASAKHASVLVDQHGDVLWVTINTPDIHNTMTVQMLQQLAAAFVAADAIKGLRAIVLTGAGTKTFCAGGQLVPSADGTPFEMNPEQVDNPVALLLRAMDKCTVPIVGRINGSAFGGGVGLVCACDIAIGVEGSQFGTTEARVGVFPLMILPALMRVIPHRQVIEMCFYAERFPATRAKELGLLNHIVLANELDEAIEGVVAKLRLNSPTALKIGRRAINAVADLSLGEALDLTQTLLPILAQSKHAKEGFRAFGERRAPVWD